MNQDQIAKMLSTYESTIRRQAAEKKELQSQLVKARAALREHWITSINCDKLTGTNYASCACSAWRGKTWTSVGAAVDEWIEHVFEEVRK